MTQCCMRMEEYQKRYTQMPNNVIQKYRDNIYSNKDNYKYYIENEEGEEND